MFKNKTVVYTSGTFDMFHYNHLRMINYARSLGDILIVGVSTDELVSSYKAPPIIPFNERMQILEALKTPDIVIPQHTLDHTEIVKKLNIDAFVVGDDWYGKYDYLRELDVQVFYFPYGTGVSSSSLRKTIHDSYEKHLQQERQAKPESAKGKDNPMMRSQRIMMTVMPIFFAFTGINFQIGVLVYWVTTNVWTMGQQFFTIRKMPAPGSAAEKAWRERENAKRARKGRPSLEEEEAAQALADGIELGGQRVQPVRKDRQKKSRPLPVTSEAQTEDAGSKDPASESTNAFGLTSEEIARRRYERRARQRQQRKNKNKKKR